MKKIFFKVISLSLISFFTISCELNDDTVMEVIDQKSEDDLIENLKTESIEIDENISNKQSDVPLFRIVSYEGGYVFLPQTGDEIPLEGAFINAEATSGFPGNLPGRWFVEGGFEIIGDNDKQTVRIQRVSGEAGKITRIVQHSNRIFYSIKNFIAIPPEFSSQCPNELNTIMNSGNTIVVARNYDAAYDYNWKVINDGNTHNYAGRNIIIPTGESVVTLTVSKLGCQSFERTQNFYVPACPTYNHALMRIDQESRTAYAQNYNSSFTYKWTVVKGNNTYQGTGRSINVGVGSVQVTLTVSEAGCTSQTNTQSDFIDVCPRC